MRYPSRRMPSWRCLKTIVPTTKTASPKRQGLVSALSLTPCKRRTSSAPKMWLRIAALVKFCTCRAATAVFRMRMRKGLSNRKPRKNSPRSFPQWAKAMKNQKSPRLKARCVLRRQLLFQNLLCQLKQTKQTLPWRVASLLAKIQKLRHSLTQRRRQIVRDRLKLQMFLSYVQRASIQLLKPVVWS